MIDINFTLILQIGHFIIAYFLLRIFLWKPVIDLIDKQDRKKEELERDLAKQKQLVEQKIFSLNRLWNNAQESFLVHMPPAIHYGGIRNEEEYRIVEPHVSQDMIQALSEKIVEKVQQ